MTCSGTGQVTFMRVRGLGIPMHSPQCRSILPSVFLPLDCGSQSLISISPCCFVPSSCPQMFVQGLDLPFPVQSPVVAPWGL